MSHIAPFQLKDGLRYALGLSYFLALLLAFLATQAYAATAATEQLVQWITTTHAACRTRSDQDIHAEREIAMPVFRSGTVNDCTPPGFDLH
jgi:hypothetical protein